MLDNKRAGRFDEASLTLVSAIAGVRLLEAHTFKYSRFDAMLVCQAESHQTISNLLGELHGWNTVSLLGTQGSIGSAVS
jgi:hypothetical protein